VKGRVGEGRREGMESRDVPDSNFDRIPDITG